MHRGLGVIQKHQHRRNFVVTYFGGGKSSRCSNGRLKRPWLIQIRGAVMVDLDCDRATGSLSGDSEKDSKKRQWHSVVDSSLGKLDRWLEKRSTCPTDLNDKGRKSVQRWNHINISGDLGSKFQPLPPSISMGRLRWPALQQLQFLAAAAPVGPAGMAMGSDRLNWQ